MRLAVAHDLTFELVDLPEPLAGAAANFCAHYVAPERPTTNAPLVVATAPPPDDHLIEAPIKFREGPLAVRERDGQILLELPGVSGWCTPDAGRGGLVVGDAGQIPMPHFSRWLLPLLLFELARPLGWFGIHAAAVAIGTRGILLPGPSGYGKSTVFTHAAAAGLEVLSDDLVWLRPRNGSADLVAFPRGGVREVPPPDVDEAILSAVVFPAIVDQPESRLVALRAPEAVARLADQTVHLARAEALRAAFQAAASIVDRVPTYRLEAGARRQEVPPLLRGVLVV